MTVFRDAVAPSTASKVVTPAARGHTIRARDIETIDSELRLLIVIHHPVWEEDGRPRHTGRIDELLDDA
jgi:hypothetical protein